MEETTTRSIIDCFIAWFPSHLVDARHFDLLKLGVFGVLPACSARPPRAC